jgi:hypothetical protein
MDSFDKMQQVSAVLEQLQSIGLADGKFAQILSSFYDNPGYENTLLIARELKGKPVEVEVLLSISDIGRLKVSSYALNLPRENIIPKHLENNGIHSAVLEGRMKVLDWKNFGRTDVQDYRLFASQQQAMDRVLGDMGIFRGDLVGGLVTANEMAIRMSDYLSSTYFSGTPLQHLVVAQSPDKETRIFFPPWVDWKDVAAHGENPQSLEQFSWACYLKQFNNPNIMNQNNLESLKGELKTLGFSEALAEKMEAQMKNNVPEFELSDRMNGLKGQGDFQLFFRQSSQSEYYYLNKFELTLTEGRGLEKDQAYLIIAPSLEDGKNTALKFANAAEAVEVFKKQTGTAELAIGTGEKEKEKMATMEEGKINFVEKDFSRVLRNPPMAQTFWLDRGKGFSAPQALNLLEGRAVYRDDLLSKEGAPYKAWVKLDMDGPRDKYMNFNVNQYHDPSYGFDLKAVLDKFPIKELSGEKTRENLEMALKNGDRPEVTIEKDGSNVKLLIEAVPRYSQINVFNLEGKPEKREQFLREPVQVKALESGKAEEKAETQSQGVGL